MGIEKRLEQAPYSLFHHQSGGGKGNMQRTFWVLSIPMALLTEFEKCRSGRARLICRRPW